MNQSLPGEHRNSPQIQPGLEPLLFSCHLDDQPDHLVPQYQGTAGNVKLPVDRPFFLNPGCHFGCDAELPGPLQGQARLLQNFASRESVIWISETGSQAWWPFCVSPRIASVLRRVRPGDPVFHEFPAPLLSALVLAGVLVPKISSQTPLRDWSERIRRCAVRFREKGYAPFGKLIHPLQISALRRYYRAMIRTGRLRLGDAQCANRYAAHNESVARFFHQQLTRTVSAMVGEMVKPSYVYFASYKEGAALEEHIDRPQCEFSITFCLDYSPEPRRETPWPLLLRTRREIVSVFQAIGDGLLYRGHRLPHFRLPLPKGHSSTSIFFHYVKKDFTGPLD